MEYFTSDTHIGHESIIEFCKRPFKNLDEMDYEISKNFMEILKPNDTLYHLGDIGYESRVKRFLLPIIQMGVKVNLIEGNHDRVKRKKLFEWGVVGVFNMLEIRKKSYNITLCHYPMLTYNKSHYDAWHLYGHHHKNTPDPEFIKGKRLNVNVEFHEYKPWNLDEIKKYMEKQPHNWDFVKK